MNKKGIELSVNFLVVIIISIAIVSASVYILTTIVGKASDLNKMTQEDLNKKIEDMQCSGIVCFSSNYKVLEKGDFHIFGLKVFNNGNPGHFTVNIIPVAQGLSFEPKTQDFGLNGNQEKKIGIGIEVPKNASSGIYIFDVKVSKLGQAGIYGAPQQIRVEVP